MSSAIISFANVSKVKIIIIIIIIINKKSTKILDIVIKYLNTDIFI